VGGPGGPRPPGGALRGRAPLRGVVGARRAGTRGETGDFQSLPLLSMPHVFFADCLLVGSHYRWDPVELSLLMGGRDPPAGRCGAETR
jgi:hypothetical protein